MPANNMRRPQPPQLNRIHISDRDGPASPLWACNISGLDRFLDLLRPGTAT